MLTKMAKTKESTNAPICPLHNKAMRELPRLPELQPHRGVTDLDMKVRRELNSAIRYRCPVEGCPRVEAIPIETPDLVELLREAPGLTRSQLRAESGLSGFTFARVLKDELLSGTIRCERRRRRAAEYFAA